MNALQDPTKKPSINSLLNPLDASGYPAHVTSFGSVALDANNGQSHGHPTAHYGSPYPANESYNLRAANWDMVEDSKRKALQYSAQAHRSYPQHHQHPQMGPPPSLNMYEDNHPSRMIMRPRMGDSREYANDNDVWHPTTQPQHDISSMSYGAPVISPMYSEERTALSGDYQPQSYDDQSRSASSPQSWQTTERASVRLAARETAPVATTGSQGVRYAPQPYYGHRNMYPTQVSYSQPQQQMSISVPPAQPLSDPVRNSGSPSSSSKRQLPDSEAAPVPKAKRAKAKAKSTGTGTATATTMTGTSRRGYNAKKRSEAALISAQNASALQRAQESESGAGNEPSYGASASNAMEGAPKGLLVPELQFARCMSNRYRKEEFPRCVSCTRRWAGDTCRFQGIRYLMRDSDRILRGLSFNENNALITSESSKVEFPTKWNRKFEKEHIRRSKLSIAKALLPTLRAEQEHLKAQEIVRRPRECDVRATCDTCMTSLFSTSFLCRLCGREVCNECFQQVRELTQEPQNASPSELAALAERRERHAHANPFFLSCTRRNEHGVSEFTPVTRFVAAELDKAVEEMQSILDIEEQEERIKSASGDGPSSLDQTLSNAESTDGRHLPSATSRPQPSNATKALTFTQFCSYPSTPFPDPLITPVYDDFTPSNVSNRITSIPIYRAQIIPASYYDPPSSPDTPSRSFAALWRNGLPLLVEGVMPRFKLRWEPEYFMEKYGDQSCLIIECQTDVIKRDWPPTSEFKKAFPELYADFSQAVPVPDYVRRDGIYNIGSHFPTNAVGPDLGPKMYNSMASSQEVGSKGSTRLHMDMADALNVMLHATPCEDGTPGYAVWDLFSAEDSDKIRAFLRKKFGFSAAGAKGPDKASTAAQVQMMAHDPIHSQQFYLDVEMRRALWQECGVKSYRIYQRPGDGIFIPAGCAHQVANMSDCMKIAIDFVSPENIDRCEKLTKEFREQNQSKVWKEDVLQLRSTMWFAWQSCCMKEAELDDDDSSLGGSAGSTVAAARNNKVSEGPGPGPSAAT